jgi:hypothetical protein
MPLTPERHVALVDALPLLAGPADAGARAGLLAGAVHAATGAGVVVVILAEDGTVQVTDGSGEGCRRLAGLEPAFGATCARTAAQAALELETAPEDRGPLARWARAAAALGWGRAHAVPLPALAPGDPAGAVVLLTRLGVRPSPADLRGTAALVAVAAAGLAQQRALDRERRRAAQFATALESRVVIEQAKGILAERGRLDPEAAFGQLRGFARSVRRQLHEVARDVVAGTAADDVLAHAGRRALPRPGAGAGEPDTGAAPSARPVPPDREAL